VSTLDDGERRRIERALHDGVQQDLIAVAVRVQLVRQLVETDVTAAIAVLDEIGRDVHDALDRVRSLANGIYPSLLDARGLPDALRSAASTLQVDATVDATVGRYPPETEAALYFYCRAALENAAADDPANARVTIRIREEAHAVQLELTGGASLAAGTDPLVAAGERVEALGGAFSVDSTPGHATRLMATVPLD
jgi:signal transduction histidine kinase